MRCCLERHRLDVWWFSRIWGRSESRGERRIESDLKVQILQCESRAGCGSRVSTSPTSVGRANHSGCIVSVIIALSEPPNSFSRSPYCFVGIGLGRVKLCLWNNDKIRSEITIFISYKHVKPDLPGGKLILWSASSNRDLPVDCG